MQHIHTIAPRPSLHTVNQLWTVIKKRNKERIHLVDVQICHLILNPSLTHQGWIHHQYSWMSNWMISQESTRTLWISKKKSLSYFSLTLKTDFRNWFYTRVLM